MNLSPTQYEALVKRASPKSKAPKTILCAFLIGGGICVIGQLLRSWFLSSNISETHTATLVAASLILLSALLTGLGVYDNLAKYAGAGTEGWCACSKSGEQCFDTCRQHGSRGRECSRHAVGRKKSAQTQ